MGDDLLDMHEYAVACHVITRHLKLQLRGFLERVRAKARARAEANSELPVFSRARWNRIDEVRRARANAAARRRGDQRAELARAFRSPPSRARALFPSLPPFLSR